MMLSGSEAPITGQPEGLESLTTKFSQALPNDSETQLRNELITCFEL